VTERWFSSSAEALVQPVHVFEDDHRRPEQQHSQQLDDHLMQPAPAELVLKSLVSGVSGSSSSRGTASSGSQGSRCGCRLLDPASQPRGRDVVAVPFADRSERQRSPWKGWYGSWLRTRRTDLE
jgi:hypothetical protein